MSRLQLILIPLLCLLASPVIAFDLYSGEVVVEGKGATERREALPDALAHVLQKLSGQWDLPENDVIASALQRSDRYLVSFQYREEEVFLADGTSELETRLVASFQPDAVNQLVREAQLPRWRPERNPIVAWVIIDDGTARQLMPLEYRYSWERIADIADLRGLPVAWPGLSEELKQQVDLQVLWGGYSDQLRTAGSDSDGVVIVAARREGWEWNVRWNYADPTSDSSWRTRSNDLSQAFAEGTHQLSNLVASINAIGPAGSGDWEYELLVSGLDSGEEYARCLGYLENLSLVDEVGVSSISPIGVVFNMNLNAAPEYFEESIARDGVLQNEEDGRSFRLAP